MSLVNAGQLCVPVSSLAHAAAVAADVSEGKLINLDTSSQAQSHLPLILPLKLGHTWEFTHLLSRSSTQAHKHTQTHWHMFAYTHSHAVTVRLLFMRSKACLYHKCHPRCHAGSMQAEYCVHMLLHENMNMHPHCIDNAPSSMQQIYPLSPLPSLLHTLQLILIRRAGV